MLFQTRPVELLYDPDNLPSTILELMKQNWLNMVLTKMNDREHAWHPMNARGEIESLVGKGVLAMPAVMEAVEKLVPEENKIIMSTLAGMFKYLKSLMKFDYIMSAVRFAFYES